MATPSLPRSAGTRPDAGGAPPGTAWRWRRAATAVVAVAALGSVTVGIGTQSRPAGGVVLATTAAQKHPPASMAPSPAFAQACFKAGALARCNRAALADINRGRRAEHLIPLRLPAGFFTLSLPRQLGVLANSERSARGLAPFTARSALDRPAQAAAARGDDPVGPADTTWTSNFSRGYVTALAADFAFMYDDGPHGPNEACPSAGAAGCWGHRNNVLAPWAGTQGAGSYRAQGTLQLTELFVEGS